MALILTNILWGASSSVGKLSAWHQMIVCSSPKNTAGNYSLFKWCLISLDCYIQRAINSNQVKIDSTPGMGCRKKVVIYLSEHLKRDPCPLHSGRSFPRSGQQFGNIARHNVVGWDEKKALQSRSTDCVLARIRNCRPFVHLKQRKLIRGLRSKTNNKQT